MKPITIADHDMTLPQLAVMDTRPPRQPPHMLQTFQRPVCRRCQNVTTRPAMAGANVVFTATWAARYPAVSFMVRVLPQLKPYQPNHRIIVPSTTYNVVSFELRLVHALIEATLARPHDVRPTQAPHAAAHMHDTRARKVHVPGADVVQPTRAGPGPGHDNRVDERTHREAEEDIPAQVKALRHSATDDGGRRRRERELEVPVQVHVVRRDNAGDAVLLDEADGEELLPANKSVLRHVAVREAPAQHPPRHRGNASVQQVLLEHRRNEPRAAASRLQHREASLHKHDQGRREDDPRMRHRSVDTLEAPIERRIIPHRLLQAPQIAQLRIVLERARLQFGDVGGKLGNLSEGVVDRHLRKAGTALEPKW